MKTLVVIGTRPEAIKMAPVIKDLKCRNGLFDVSVCLTAQHRDLLDQVVEIFGINIDYDLNLMRPNQDIFEVTAKVLSGMKRVLDEARPDLMLVHGDTTTSFAAGLAGYYERINIGHVEAGLRTFDNTKLHSKTDVPPEKKRSNISNYLKSFYFTA
jgi:UDP-N-acetylglucosamine 2-epimerase (non-hydrolysing)